MSIGEIWYSFLLSSKKGVIFMGTVSSILKSGLNSAKSQFKSYDVEGQINSALSVAGSDLNIPKPKMPEAMKNMKLNIDPSVVKLPAGVDSYISPFASKLISNMKLPSEINGVQIPQMPDLSSVSLKVDEYLSGFGLDTNKLGIRSVNDILKEPDLSSLKSVQFESPIDLNNMPDLTKSLDSFDMGGLQGQINELTNGIPGMDKLDLSQYF